ncbi:3beta-hydroxysteroid-dehydrogenase/decarboxylase isoform X2 [Malania oleifera]|uniref:3beta-hydroxysteroid-dehydrogenase/decarboxylase isoform X2 n=1 Tax=Malania oleifera TaxID=397392 RepID=UPI0025AE914E|nr:3beta-hydroxysteroid-dehydrogenase/decarboxylase isoform X2 [Malania oleifera]
MAIDEPFVVAGKESYRTCVVFGGRGFVGRSLVLRLLKLGNWIVRIADSAQSLELDPSERDSLLSEAVSDRRASYVQVDVRHKSQIVNAIEGSSVVFYTDATTTYADGFYNCYMVIVKGVKNVISACRECKVKQLIYNSSADVVFDGSRDIHGGDESLPYPWKFKDMFSDLKSQAEALVLFANDIDGLLTCVLRPSIVFGPGDRQLVPFLLNNAKSGWSKFIIGNGENMSDFTYVENVAHAHICAEEALCSRMVSAAGKAFFITNLEPMKFWDFVSLILEGLGYQRPFIKLPVRMVWYILLLVKWTHEKLCSRKQSHLLSSQYFFQLASCTRTFKCSAAQKHIKYSPVVPLKEGVSLTSDSFSHLSKDSQSVRYMAEILLWRDEKKTFTCFLVLVLLFYWFFLCGRTFVSSAAKLLMLVIVILFGHGFLPSKMFGFNVQRISLSCFEIPDMVVEDSFIVIATLWNRGVDVIRALAKGNDWNLFLKVAFPLYLLRIISSYSMAVVVGAVLIIAFTALFIYEQYESEIDGLVEISFNVVKNLSGLLMRNLPAPVVKILRNFEIVNQNEELETVKDWQ